MKTPNNRWFSLALAVPAFLLLTGAKGEGCGGSVEFEPEPAPAETCPAGSHLSTFCDDTPEPVSSSSDSSGADPAEPGCRSECVPDDVCPDGTVAVRSCEQPVPLPCEWDSASGGEPDCTNPEPPTAECTVTCEPACAPGSSPEWVCYGNDAPIVSGEPESDSADEPMPPPEPTRCFLECVPDLCPPGFTEMGVCSINEGDAAGTCWTECVPEPECPPGCYAEGSCAGSDGSGAPEEECVTVCRCDEPSEPSQPEPPQAS